MNLPSRFAPRLLAAVALLFAALAVARVAALRPQGDALQRSPLLLAGFYDPELSTTLPGSHGPLSRELRWTAPTSSLRLWPALPTSGVLELEYLNPAQRGQISLQVAEEPPVALPPTPTLRRLRLLLPSGAATVRLEQSAPLPSTDRPLGLIVSEARWGALPLAAWTDRLGLIRRLLPELPLTLALLYLLARLAGLRRARAVALLALALCGLAALSWRWPADSRAAQPMVQGLLLCALGGAALWRTRRWLPFAAIRRWPLVIGAAWALSALLWLTPTVGHDGVGYYAYLRSFFIDGDIRFDNEFDPALSPFSDVPDLRRTPTPTGYTPNTWSVGPALLWTPFWLVAHGLTWLGRALGLPWQPDGYAPPYIVLIALGSSLTGLATMLGCFVLARRWWSPGLAALAAITIYAGSNLLFYAQLEGSFAHSLSAATTTGCVIATLGLADRPTWRRWLLLGLAAGAMVVAYWVTALWLLLPLTAVLRLVWPRLRAGDWRGVGRLAAGALLAATAALLVCLPQMLAWRQIYGGWLTAPQGNDFITPGNHHLLEVLAGPLYGLAWWTPAFALGLLGAIGFAWRRPWPGGPLLAVALLYLFYNASLPEWFGNGGFGMRRLTPLVPVCALGLAAIFAALRRAPALALAGAIAGWGLQMTARYVVYDLPHDPYVLMDLRVRDLVLTPERLALAPLGAMTRTSWLGRFILAPNLGDALLLAVGLLLGLALLAWRRRTKAPLPQPQAVQPVT